MLEHWIGMPSVETIAKRGPPVPPSQAPHWPIVLVLPGGQAPIKLHDAPKIMDAGMDT